MGKMVSVAVDAMGGDYAPSEIVKGAVWAAHDYNVAIELVGQVDKIQEVLDKIAKKGIRCNRGGYFEKKIKQLFSFCILRNKIFYLLFSGFYLSSRYLQRNKN